jgi:glycine cleavage system H protein
MPKWFNAGLTTNPQIANSDPYGEGWMVKVRPSDWAAAKAGLVPGMAVAGPFEAKMAADNFSGCA